MLIRRKNLIVFQFKYYLPLIIIPILAELNLKKNQMHFDGHGILKWYNDKFKLLLLNMVDGNLKKLANNVTLNLLKHTPLKEYFRFFLSHVRFYYAITQLLSKGIFMRMHNLNKERKTTFRHAFRRGYYIGVLRQKVLLVVL